MKDTFNDRNKYLQQVRCNLCNADNYRVMYLSTVGDTPPSVEEYTSTVNKYGAFHNIVKCMSCGLVYMNPRDAGTVTFYKDVIDEEYLKTWQERAGTFRGHLTTVQKYKPHGDILDMGCYAGIFLDEARKQGYRVSGIEPSAWASEYARKKTGAQIITGSCSDRHFQKESFDVVTLWDVIEHLENPSASLSLVYDYLRVEGIAAITTHDIGSLFARLTGRKYPWLMRFHLYHFTPNTLSALLLKNGLQPISTVYYSKTFSFRYLLGRFGINMQSALFEKIRIPVNTGDMFMIVAKKKAGRGAETEG